jgi:hypothetical protein
MNVDIIRVFDGTLPYDRNGGEGQYQSAPAFMLMAGLESASTVEEVEIVMYARINPSDVAKVIASADAVEEHVQWVAFIDKEYSGHKAGLIRSRATRHISGDAEAGNDWKYEVTTKVFGDHEESNADCDAGMFKAFSVLARSGLRKTRASYNVDTPIGMLVYELDFVMDEAGEFLDTIKVDIEVPKDRAEEAIRLFPLFPAIPIATTEVLQVMPGSMRDEKIRAQIDKFTGNWDLRKKKD